MRQQVALLKLSTDEAPLFIAPRRRNIQAGLSLKPLLCTLDTLKGNLEWKGGTVLSSEPVEARDGIFECIFNEFALYLRRGGFGKIKGP